MGRSLEHAKFGAMDDPMANSLQCAPYHHKTVIVL